MGMVRFSKKILHYINNHYLHISSSMYRRHSGCFCNKYGLEIGGPSTIFEIKGSYPIYDVASGMDNCTFSARTVWHNHTSEFHYQNNKLPGKQFFCEAADFSSALSGRKYDFILSSHALEHISNPIKALLKWHELLVDQGVFLLLLPDSRYTFDRNRQITTFSHFHADYSANIDERDLSHMDEIIAGHDYTADPGADFDGFRQRCLNNYENRCMHHHVFNYDNAVKLLDYCHWNILAFESRYPCHLIFLLRAK
jgi:SAM-dependent methyltransferase